MKYKMVQVIDHKATGAHWRVKRKAKKISLRKLARHMELSWTYVGDWELGKRNWNKEREERYRVALEEVWKEGAVVVGEEDWPDGWPLPLESGEVLASVGTPEEFTEISFSLRTVPCWYRGWYSEGWYRGQVKGDLVTTFLPDQVHSWKYTEVVR